MTPTPTALLHPTPLSYPPSLPKTPVLRGVIAHAHLKADAHRLLQAPGRPQEPALHAPAPALQSKGGQEPDQEQRTADQDGGNPRGGSPKRFAEQDFNLNSRN